VTNGEISEACAVAAANWWGDVLMEPPSHRNGDAFQSMLGQLVAARSEPVTEGQRAAFVTALRFSILHSGFGGMVNLGVDYDPCPELKDAARAAGIDGARFPWKTNMYILGGEVVVSRGYRGGHVRIWPPKGDADAS
jgi:hypothetical protein